MTLRLMLDGSNKLIYSRFNKHRQIAGEGSEGSIGSKLLKVEKSRPSIFVRTLLLMIL